MSGATSLLVIRRLLTKVHQYDFVCLLYIFFIIMATLQIASYNSCGLGNNKMDYIANLCANNDFVCIQETWLLTENLGIFLNKIPNIVCHGVSAMDSGKVHRGRNFGGCTIIWKSNLACKVSPVDCKNVSLCAVTVEFSPGSKFLLTNAYMPTDTRTDRANLRVYDDILSEAAAIGSRLGISHIIFAGDFNTDFGRIDSLHTISLKQFMSDESLVEPINVIDYTYESKINGEKSHLDHFLVSPNFEVLHYKVVHTGDNQSDHSYVVLSLSVSLDYVASSDCVHKSGRLNWDGASDECIGHYQRRLSHLLGNVIVPIDAVNCVDHRCTAHNHDISQYCSDIVSCLKDAGEKTIPKCKPPGKRSPGWNDDVRPKRDDSIFGTLYGRSAAPRKLAGFLKLDAALAVNTTRQFVLCVFGVMRLSLRKWPPPSTVIINVIFGPSPKRLTVQGNLVLLVSMAKLVTQLLRLYLLIIIASYIIVFRLTLRK